MVRILVMVVILLAITPSNFSVMDGDVSVNPIVYLSDGNHFSSGSSIGLRVIGRSAFWVFYTRVALCDGGELLKYTKVPIVKTCFRERPGVPSLVTWKLDENESVYGLFVPPGTRIVKL